MILVGQRVSVRVCIKAAARRNLAGECVQCMQHGGRRPLSSKRPGHGDDSTTFVETKVLDGGHGALSPDKRRGGTHAPRLIAT